LYVRHRDVLDAVDFTEVGNADGVPVSALAREQQFLFEAPLDVLRCDGISRDFGTNHLQRDGDFELGIPSLVHGAHTAYTELFQDVIAGPELLANLQRS